MSESDTSGSWAEVFAPRYATVTLILCLGVALFAFNAFLGAVSLPTAVQDVGGLALISWATTLYLVFAIVGGAGAALLKLRFGARHVLLASTAVFLVGTIIAAQGGTMTEVLIGRALQGLGEGVVGAICFALIPDLFPARLVPKVFGMQAAVWAVAAFGGPLGAGLLTEMVSWRAAFLVNVPLALIFAGMVALVIRDKHVRSAEQADFPGLRLLLIGGGIMLVALASLSEALVATGLLIGAGILLTTAVMRDRRGIRTRLMPPGAFWPTTVIGAGLWVVLLISAAGAISTVYLILLLQQLFGLGPLLAGGVAAVMSVAWSISSIGVANVKSRTTRHLLVRGGPILIGLGMALVLVGLLSGQMAIVIVAQLTVGTGFGIASGYLNLTLMEAASDAERDRTSALLPTTQSAGNALGAALAGLAANSAGLAKAVSVADIHQAIIPVFVLASALGFLAALAAWQTTRLVVPGSQSSFAAG